MSPEDILRLLETPDLKLRLTHRQPEGWSLWPVEGDRIFYANRNSAHAVTIVRLSASMHLKRPVCESPRLRPLPDKRPHLYAFTGTADDLVQLVKQELQLYRDSKGLGGARSLPLDTVGSEDRAIPDKVSQSIQFDRQAAGQPLNLLHRTFPDFAPGAAPASEEDAAPSDADDGGDVMLWTCTNPHNVDLNRPYLYLIVVRSPTREYRYVGKGSDPSRMSVYFRMITKIRAGKSKNAAQTSDGRVQSKSNLQYRYVHLVLAVAVERGWTIEHYPLENCDKANHTTLEKQRILEQKCNMNKGSGGEKSWFVEDFRGLAQKLT